MPSLKENKRKFRTAYSPPVRVGYCTVGESKTDPIFAEDLKIQNMIKRYDHQGYLSTIDRHAHYADFSDINDLHGAMEKVRHANEDFQKVPSYIRERFENDPKLFYQFATDPDNREELIDMGLIDSPKAERVFNTTEESQPKVEKTQESSKEDS